MVAKEKRRRNSLSRAYNTTLTRSESRNALQDLGNTNYSLHVPRASFDRRSTADVVVKALRSMEIPADVNERNDICVQGYKISTPD